MAVVPTINSHNPQNANLRLFINPLHQKHYSSTSCYRIKTLNRRRPLIINESRASSNQSSDNEQDRNVDNIGVKAALSVLTFYKRVISPILPKSCRYVPTCSEYSMEAYKRYGFVKGTVLTAWRLCRCNPLGGSGFDPPRWFDERSLPEE